MVSIASNGTRNAEYWNTRLFMLRLVDSRLIVSKGKNGINLIGTSAEDVDKAEDRSRFSQVLDSLHIMQPPWQAFSNLQDAKNKNTLEYVN